VTAALGLAALTAIMADLKRLKLIAASDDAPAGFKGASIKINAPTMAVTVSVREATSLLFIPINILVSAVQQSASSG